MAGHGGRAAASEVHRRDRFGSSAVDRAAILKVGRPAGGDAYADKSSTVAPAVLGNEERLHSCSELRFTVIVHDTREGVELSVADPDFDMRLRPNVAHQVCASRSVTR